MNEEQEIASLKRHTDLLLGFLAGFVLGAFMTLILAVLIVKTHI